MALESQPSKPLPPDMDGIIGANVFKRYLKPDNTPATGEVVGVAGHGDAENAIAPFADGGNRAELPPLHPALQEVLAHRRRPLRYVPNIGLLMCVLDIFLMGAAQIGLIELSLDHIALNGPIQDVIMAAIGVVPAVLFLHALGEYRREAITASTASLARIAVALGFSSLVLFVVFFYELAALQSGRGLLLGSVHGATQALMIALASTGVSFSAIIVSRIVVHAMRGKSWLRRRILVIGNGQRARHLRRLMAEMARQTSSDLFFVPASIISRSGEILHNSDQGSIAGSSGKSLDALTRELSIDEIVMASDDRRQLPMAAFLACKVNGTPVTDYAAFLERETGRVDLHQPDLSWLTYSNGFRLSLIDEFAKRTLDVLVSLILLAICMPVLIAAIISIWIEGYGPIFIRQERITKNGRVFLLFKLRTMRSDAESKGPQWAAERDPRITRVGALLRRCRIDELPQLVNVLYGDMSLVGPRPERPVFVDQLSRSIELYPLRHTFKAGLTGWAQINYPYGASEDDARRKLEYDLYYIKNYNLLRELSIILQTLRVLLWPPGVR